MAWDEIEGVAGRLAERQALPEPAERGDGDRRPATPSARRSCITDEMPWEMSQQGLLEASAQRADEHADGDGRRLYADHPAGQPLRASTGTWRRNALYVVEGNGYDLHQDCDVEIADTYKRAPQPEIKRYEWEAGDVIYVPPAPSTSTSTPIRRRPARLISCLEKPRLQEFRPSTISSSSRTRPNTTPRSCSPPSW